MSGTDYELTPNLGLYKPIYDMDEGQWGTHLNENSDILDALFATGSGPFLPLAGGTLTGPLQLPNGTLAIPSLQIGPADGTGISRSANVLIFGVQNTMALAMFANAAQFYASLSMLNNRITQVGDATAPGDALNMRSGDARYATAAALAGMLPLSGGTMTGPLVLAGDGAMALSPVTVQQVNAVIAQLLPLSGGTLTGPLGLPAGAVNAPSLTLGTANSGIYGAGSNTVVTSIGTQVISFGLGGITAFSTLSMNNLRITTLADATAAQDALNMRTGDVRYAPFGSGGGGSSVTISDTPPASPTVGNMWFDSVGTQLYLWYTDPTSSQWVPTTNQSAGILEAPHDGAYYARHNQAWSNLATAPQVQTNVGRNVIHNPMMAVAQRGAGPFTGNGYTLDRWAAYAVGGDAMTVTRAAMADADRAQIGDESAEYSYSRSVTGSATAGSASLTPQAIEDVRRLAGKTVTVSFWAKCLSGAFNLGVSLDQNFGTGGSPSATVLGNGQAVVLSSTWTRYSRTFVLASAAAKTLGTNGDSNTTLNFWLSAEPSFNVRSGSVGVQTGTFGLWGVQLEVGSVATPLEKIDPRMDLANCQRFYQTFAMSLAAVATAAGQTFGYDVVLLVTMRATPTAAAVNNSSSNLGAITFYPAPGTLAAVAGSSAAGGININLTASVSADL